MEMQDVNDYAYIGPDATGREEYKSAVATRGERSYEKLKYKRHSSLFRCNHQLVIYVLLSLSLLIAITALVLILTMFCQLTELKSLKAEMQNLREDLNRTRHLDDVTRGKCILK